MTIRERATGKDESDDPPPIVWSDFQFPRRLDFQHLNNRQLLALTVGVLTTALVVHRLYRGGKEIDIVIPDTSEDYPQAEQGDIIEALILLGIEPADIAALKDVSWQDPRKTTTIRKRGHREKIVAGFRDGFDSIAALLRVREDAARRHHVDDELSIRIKERLIEQFKVLFERYELDALRECSFAEVIERIRKRESGEDSPY